MCTGDLERLIVGLAKVGLGRVRVEKKGRVGSGSKNEVDPRVEKGSFCRVLWQFCRSEIYQNSTTDKFQINL